MIIIEKEIEGFENYIITSENLKINRKTLNRILFDNKENNYNYDFKAIT